jgi:signal transduction histidine kinase
MLHEWVSIVSIFVGITTILGVIVNYVRLYLKKIAQSYADLKNQYDEIQKSKISRDELTERIVFALQPLQLTMSSLKEAIDDLKKAFGQITVISVKKDD